MPRFCFTDHAIDRFVERHAPEMSRTDARRYLEEAVLLAVRLKEKTIKGETQWKLEDGIVLVVKEDNRLDVCVTVLPEPPQHGFTEDEMERIREYTLANPDDPTQRPKLPERFGYNLNPEHVARLERKKLEHEARQFFEMALTDKQLKKLLHIGRLEASKVRQVEKTKRHLDHQAAEILRLREALRIALRALHDLDDKDTALEDIRALEASFVSQDFLRKAS